MIQIRIWYEDRDGVLTSHVIEEDRPSLTYRDPNSAPTEVLSICAYGFTIGRFNKDTQEYTRSGVHIPAHRIVAVDFSDDYAEASR